MRSSCVPGRPPFELLRRTRCLMLVRAYDVSLCDDAIISSQSYLRGNTCEGSRVDVRAQRAEQQMESCPEVQGTAAEFVLLTWPSLDPDRHRHVAATAARTWWRAMTVGMSRPGKPRLIMGMCRVRSS